MSSHLINKLPSSMIEGKTPLKVWSEKVAQDYDRFRYLVLYMLSCQGRQVGTESEKMSVRWIQERRKRLQNMGFKVQEVYLEQGCHI